MKKGEVMEAVLAILTEGPRDMEDLFVVLITSGYGVSLKTLERKIAKRAAARASEDRVYQERQRLYSVLSRLKKEGFIQKKEGRYSATILGAKKLKAIRDLFQKKKRYERREDKLLKIIAFDIPERMRSKRTWLRGVLAELDFKMLQKSVWIGIAALPEEFVSDLRNLELIDHVDIFAVTKTGTIRSLK